MTDPIRIQIHLDHIRQNLETLRAVVGPRKLLVAVKANAYGHGAVAVARLAQEGGADWLGVAKVSEGLRLRAAGIRLPILNMSLTYPEEMDAAVGAGLTFVVADEDGVRTLEAACAARRTVACVHLKIDTGMGRIGCSPEEAPALARFVEDHCPHLRLEGLCTHLHARGEAPVNRFKAAVAQVEAALHRRPELVHCANSAALLGEPDCRMDMVRLGILVYGHLPEGAAPGFPPLLPGLSFTSRLAFLKRVEAGTPIGYGGTWTAPARTWIGTVSCGYGDGFSRHFSNRGRVLVGGRSCPVVGRVCMDQTMVDLGPEPRARVGDEVVLIGRSGAQEITVGEWAEALGTIAYEVTCMVGARTGMVPEPRPVPAGRFVEE